MKKSILYVGLDVHKNAIDVALAEDEVEGEARSYGKIDSNMEALNKLIRKIKTKGSKLQFAYEAGPCGYEVYRYLISKGHGCAVVAPSMIPRRSGDRIKTDRRDAVNLARLFRAGELTSIYIPTQEDEAMRDLLRCRDDIRRLERKARQPLLAFLLRHGFDYPDKNWKAT